MIRSPHVSTASCFQRVPCRLAQRSAGIEQHLEAAEEVLPQRAVSAEMRDERIVALGHIEIDGGRDLAQIAHGLGEPGGGGVAFIDVERAAVGEHQVEVVIGAERMTPGKPIDHDRGVVPHEAEARRQHRLVRAQHPLGIDHRLRRAGRTGGEQELGDGVRANCRMRAIDRVGRWRGKLGEGRSLPAGNGVACQHKLGRGGENRVDRAREQRPIVGEDEARSEQLHDGAQLGEVAGHERIRRRDRRIGNADIHRCEPEHRLLDVVARQKCDGSLRRKIPLQERSRDAARLMQHLGVGERSPRTAAIALRQEYALGRGGSPVFEPLRELLRIRAELRGGADQQRAIGPALLRDLEHTEGDGSQSCLRSERSRTGHRRFT